MSDTSGFTTFGHLEAMGHRGHWGLISEKQIAGASFLQIECFKLGANEPVGVFLYPPASIYCLTPCTEDKARMMCTPYAERPEELKQLDAPSPPWADMDVDVEDDDQDEHVDARS